MRPYLSLVVAARNDNYGGNFLRRMQSFLSVLAALSDRHALSAELLVVEWNPPANQPPLRDAIHWPTGRKGLSVRVVTVPQDAHRSLPNSDKMPMFEYLAKNVGIRRAAGEFVLATNPDIVLSGDLIAYLAAGLQQDCYYRVDRHDIDKAVPLNLPVDAQMAFCAAHTIRVLRRQSVEPGRPLRVLKYRIRTSLPRLLPQRLLPGLVRRAVWLVNPNVRKAVEEADPLPAAPIVHSHAAGDFLLMAREQWHSLRAFPELPTFSHIDCYMVFIAAIAGLKEVVLPFPIFHQEHGHSENDGRPVTDLGRIPAFRSMLEKHKLTITNDDKWGLRDLDLPSAIVQ